MKSQALTTIETSISPKEENLISPKLGHLFWSTYEVYPRAFFGKSQKFLKRVKITNAKMSFCTQNGQNSLKSVVHQQRNKGMEFSGNTISISRFQDLKFMDLQSTQEHFNALKREIGPREK